MNPLTLFLDMVAVAAGLAINGAVLGGLALAWLALLGEVKAAQSGTPQDGE